MCIARLARRWGAWDQIIHNDFGQLPVLEARDFVDAKATMLVAAEEFADELRLLGHGCQGSQVPTVTQSSLVDVTRRDGVREDSDLSLVAEFTGALPNNAWVVLTPRLLEQRSVVWEEFCINEP